MAAGGTGGTDLFAAGCLLAGVVEVPAGAVGAEGVDESELVPFVDGGAADAVPGGELAAGDGVAGAWRAARGGDLVACRAGLAGLVEAEAAVVGRGDGDGPPRTFRTALFALFHAASCRFRYSSWASCGVL